MITPIFAGYIVAAAVTPSTMPNATFPYVLYLGTGDSVTASTAYYGSGVYESLNGGQSWTLLTQTAGFDIQSAVTSGTTATITTAVTHNFQIGEQVTIANVSVAGYDGTYTIISVPSPTTFTYALSGSLADGTGGTAEYDGTTRRSPSSTVPIR